jgi:hypothetical protein
MENLMLNISPTRELPRSKSEKFLEKVPAPLPFADDGGPKRKSARYQRTVTPQAHEFIKKHVITLVKCAICDIYIWGITKRQQEGLRCTKCDETIHINCKTTAMRRECVNKKKGKIVKRKFSLKVDDLAPLMLDMKSKRENVRLNEQLLILEHGYVAASYENTGTIIINNVYTRSSPIIIQNPHPIIIMKGIFPFIFSAHTVLSDRDTPSRKDRQTFVQIFNIRTKFKIEKLLPSIQTIVVDKAVIIITADAFYNITFPFDEEFLSEDSITLNELHLPDNSPKIFQNISPLDASIRNNKIMIQSVDRTSIQVWELLQHSTKASCTVNVKVTSDTSPIRYCVIGHKCIVGTIFKGGIFKINHNSKSKIMSDDKLPISSMVLFDEIEKIIFLGDINGNIKQMDENTMKIQSMLTQPDLCAALNTDSTGVRLNMDNDVYMKEWGFPLYVLQMVKIRQFLIVVIRTGVMICSLNLKNQVRPLMILELDYPPWRSSVYDEVLYINCRNEDEEIGGCTEILTVIKIDWIKLAKHEVKIMKLNL